MSAWISAGWNTAIQGAITATFTDTGGASAITVTTGNYMHVTATPVSYSSVGATLETLLNADATLNGTYTIAFSTATLAYTLSCTEAFTISVATTEFTNVFGDLTTASSTSHVSQSRPYYLLAVVQGAFSDRTDDYEPAGFVETSVADDGSTYSIASTVLPVHNDFVVPFEAQAGVFKRFATAAAAVLWTYQDFWEHTRGQYPFAALDDSGKTIHKMRRESSNFRPRREISNYNDYWTISFRTYVYR